MERSRQEAKIGELEEKIQRNEEEQNAAQKQVEQNTEIQQRHNDENNKKITSLKE